MNGGYEEIMVASHTLDRMIYFQIFSDLTVTNPCIVNPAAAPTRHPTMDVERCQKKSGGQKKTEPQKDPKAIEDKSVNVTWKPTHKVGPGNLQDECISIHYSVSVSSVGRAVV